MVCHCETKSCNLWNCMSLKISWKLRSFVQWLLLQCIVWEVFIFWHFLGWTPNTAHRTLYFSNLRLHHLYVEMYTGIILQHYWQSLFPFFFFCRKTVPYGLGGPRLKRSVRDTKTESTDRCICAKREDKKCLGFCQASAELRCVQIFSVCRTDKANSEYTCSRGCLYLESMCCEKVFLGLCLTMLCFLTVSSLRWKKKCARKSRPKFATASRWDHSVLKSTFLVTEKGERILIFFKTDFYCTIPLSFAVSL